LGSLAAGVESTLGGLGSGSPNTRKKEVRAKGNPPGGRGRYGAAILAAADSVSPNKLGVDDRPYRGRGRPFYWKLTVGGGRAGSAGIGGEGKPPAKNSKLTGNLEKRCWVWVP